MKDIVIKGRQIRREIIVWICCVAALTARNAYAIVQYGTSWSELLSLWYVILPLSVLLYAVLIPIRWAGRLVLRLVCGKGGCRKRNEKAKA